MASSSAAGLVVLAVVSSSLLGMGWLASAQLPPCKDCSTYCSSKCTTSVTTAAASWDPCSSACGGPSPECMQSCKNLSFTECTNLCKRYYGGSSWTADSYCSYACRPSYIDYDTPCSKKCCSSPEMCQRRRDEIIQMCTSSCTSDCKTRCVNA